MFKLPRLLPLGSLAALLLLSACAAVPPSDVQPAGAPPAPPVASDPSAPPSDAQPAVAPAAPPAAGVPMKHGQRHAAMQQGQAAHAHDPATQHGQDSAATCPMMKMMHQHGGGQATPGAAMTHNHPLANSDNPVIRAYAQANRRMCQAMSFQLTGDADQDFLRAMIPHHQGAIDRARVALAHGKDPRVRKLAMSIIKAHEKEIALMQAWMGQPTTAAPTKSPKKKTPAPAPMASPAPAPEHGATH